MKRFLIVVLIGLLLGGCGLARTPNVHPRNFTSFSQKMFDDNSLKNAFPKPKKYGTNKEVSNGFL